MKAEACSAEAFGKLESELMRLKRKVGLGFDVKVAWHPSETKIVKGREVEELVEGNIIHIYTPDPNRALELLRHGFAEWLLNQHSKPYRMLINKLLDLLEDLYYERKEEVADALTKLFQD
jgi:hypothetical protein